MAALPVPAERRSARRRGGGPGSGGGWWRAGVGALAACVVGAAAAGAALDHGNPPALSTARVSGLVETWYDPAGLPAALALPVVNRGPAAVLLSVAVAGTGRAYALSLDGAAPFRPGCMAVIGALPATRRCAGVPLRLAGTTVPHQRFDPRAAAAGWWGRGVGVVVGLAAPPAGDCWRVSAVTLRYRVGFATQESTSPVDVRVCTGPMRDPAPLP